MKVVKREKMKDLMNEEFKKYAGIDLLTATRILMKNGIETNDIENLAAKLFNGVIEEVDKKILDDNYKILLHLVVTYYIFKSANKTFKDWIKEEAAEHNMKPEKYIKVMFS